MLVVNLFGAPGGSRTHYPCLRRAVLYPNELRVQTPAIVQLKRKNAIERFIGFNFVYAKYKQVGRIVFNWSYL